MLQLSPLSKLLTILCFFLALQASSFAAGRKISSEQTLEIVRGHLWHKGLKAELTLEQLKGQADFHNPIKTAEKIQIKTPKIPEELLRAIRDF